eukprot:7387735-Prymnesium_polylepis.1
MWRITCFAVWTSHLIREGQLSSDERCCARARARAARARPRPVVSLPPLPYLAKHARGGVLCGCLTSLRASEPEAAKEILLHRHVLPDFARVLVDPQQLLRAVLRRRSTDHPPHLRLEPLDSRRERRASTAPIVLELFALVQHERIGVDVVEQMDEAQLLDRRVAMPMCRAAPLLDPVHHRLLLALRLRCGPPP